MGQEIPQRAVGSQGLKASAQGLGIIYGDVKHKPNEKENQEVLERAVELGATFIDTSNVYGSGISEEQFGIAIKKGRERFTVATKVGLEYIPGEGSMGTGGVCGTPDYVRKEIQLSLDRLNTDHVDLYYQHRVDRTVPIEDTWKALKEQVDSGKVKYLGISEATPDEIKSDGDNVYDSQGAIVKYRAISSKCKVNQPVELAAYALRAITANKVLRYTDIQEEIIPLCRELGIAIVCYSPLGRGFLTGEIASLADLSPEDRRKNIGRFKDANFEHNLNLVVKLKEKAKKKGITAGQLALAWLHHQGEDVFPIPGTKRVKYLEENVAAFFVKLSKEEVDELSKIFHPQASKGERAAEAQLKHQFEAQKSKK